MLRPASFPSLSNYLQQSGIAPLQLRQLLSTYSAEVQAILSAQISHYEEPEVWIDAKTWQQTVDEFSDVLLADSESAA